jgi:small subunit ribosomal protein S21
MSKINPECGDSEAPDHRVTADVLLRQEPDDEDEEEDEDNGKHKDEDDDDDEGDNSDGYSEWAYLVFVLVSENSPPWRPVHTCYSARDLTEASTDGVSFNMFETELVGGWWVLAEIRLQEGESLENALRRFKRKVQTEDIIKEVKRHSYYLKPGEKKRVKQALARKRARKKIRKDSE